MAKKTSLCNDFVDYKLLELHSWHSFLFLDKMNYDKSKNYYYNITFFY